MDKRHAREVQVEVEKATVELKGEVTKKGRMARQSEAEIKSLHAERSQLMEQLERAIADRNENLKRIGRERERRQCVMLVSGKVGAHTRDKKTDRRLR